MAQPIKAPDLEAILREFQRPVRFAGWAEVPCAAAGDYAAGDVLSASATANAGRATYVPKLARDRGGVATIVGIRATCTEDAVLTSLRLHFFKRAPLVAEVEMDDNAAFDLVTAAGRDKWVGSILLNAFADRGTSGSTSDNADLREPFACSEEDDGLWMVVTTEVAEANESANMVLHFDFYCL